MMSLPVAHLPYPRWQRISLHLWHLPTWAFFGMPCRQQFAGGYRSLHHGGYRHHVSGFFPSLARAESTMSTLAKRGFGAVQLQIYSGDADSPTTPNPLAKSNVVLKNMLVVETHSEAHTAIGR